MKTTTTKKRALKKLAQAPATLAEPSQSIPPEPLKPYEPTQRERSALDAFRTRRRERSPAPSLKNNVKDGVSTWAVDHPDKEVGSALAVASLGLSSGDAWGGLVSQLVNVATKGKTPTQDRANEVLAMVQEIQPRDATEAMLAAQMVAVHEATMTFARRLNHVDTIQQQDSASNAFNKLARTFTAQVEALNRHRGKGQQAIRVEHVTVNGGQAIVGSNIHPQGAGSSTISEAQPHAPRLTHAPVAPMPCTNTERETVPVAPGERAEAMSDARRG